MRKTVIITTCDSCGKEISDANYIETPYLEGKDCIIFNDIKKDFFFNNEIFCCLKCLFDFMVNWLKNNQPEV